MANPQLSVANEFGLSTPGGSGGSAPEPTSFLGTVSASSKQAWYRHPALGLAVVVAGTFALIGHATAGASASAHVGRAKATAEGEI